jgi:hypothetical protein
MATLGPRDVGRGAVVWAAIGAVSGVALARRADDGLAPAFDGTTTRDAALSGAVIGAMIAVGAGLPDLLG